jgi:hypothetical protein
MRKKEKVHAALLFHVWLEGTVTRDPDGEELPDADAAWEYARAAALDLMQADLGRPVNWLKCHVEVSTGDDEIVLELPFAECMEITHSPH